MHKKKRRKDNKGRSLSFFLFIYSRTQVNLVLLIAGLVIGLFGVLIKENIYRCIKFQSEITFAKENPLKYKYERTQR